MVVCLFVYLVGSARDGFERVRRGFDLWPPLMPMLGGMILALSLVVIPTDYLGLSLPPMDQTFASDDTPYFGLPWKSIRVAVTLGSGFYGGIVTPQFVLGAITGNTFAHLLGISPALRGAIGLVSVASAASNAPIAAILMGVELFGQMNGSIYVAGASIAAYLMIGHRSVHPDQLVAFSRTLPDPWPGYAAFVPRTAPLAHSHALEADRRRYVPASSRSMYCRIPPCR